MLLFFLKINHEIYCLFFKDAVNNGSNGNNNQQDLANNSCDLSALDPLCNDSEEFLRQLAENPFELDSFFTEYTGVDVKVRFKTKLYLNKVFY